MKQFIAVLLILASGVGTITYLSLTKPEGETIEPERPVANVETITVEKTDVSVSIETQGTVLPEIEIDLPIEVSGRIIAVSDHFKVGQRVSLNEVLFKIDPADYQAALASARAEVARAELSLAQETALAEQAAQDWQAFGKRIEEASPLTLRKPQLNQAQAILESAKSSVKQAERNLNRTVVRAPFDGYILSKSVDLGQFVSATPSGTAARIFSAKRAEVRLPLTEAQLDLLGDTLGPVTFRAKSGNANHTWMGQLVRLEATVDTATRLNYAVAQIEEPFDRNPPLRRGRFVQAVIQGRNLSEAVELPSYALRGSDTVYVMTVDGKLQTRKVTVLSASPHTAIITDGLKTSEKVAISPVAFFVEGMPVVETSSK